MNHYSIYVELDVTKPTTEKIESVSDGLQHLGYHAAVGTSPAGRLDVQMTVPAGNLWEALARGIVPVQQIGGATTTEAHGLPEEEFDRRQGFQVTEVPDMLSVSDAAARLGVSRQRILQMLDRNEFLNAQKVGATWVIPVDSVMRRIDPQYTARQDPDVHYEASLPTDS